MGGGELGKTYIVLVVSHGCGVGQVLSWVEVMET
jgi:hypothetical protein